MNLGTWLIDRAVGTHKSVSMNEETAQKMLARFYESQPVRDYIEQRERYLVDQAVDRFIGNKMDNARGLAGQLVELRAFRARIMAAWFHTKKPNKGRTLMSGRT